MLNLSVIDLFGRVSDDMTDNTSSRFQYLDSINTENNNSSELDAFDIKCTFVNSTISKNESMRINCTELVPVVVSIQEGRYCKTFFSGKVYCVYIKFTFKN